MRRLNHRYLVLATAVVLIAVIGVATVSGDSILQQIRSTPGGVPETLTYSGYLTDEKGNPVSDGLSIIFTIYDSETDGRPLWQEGHTVKVIDGLFTVELGTENSISRGLTNSAVWLGIQVDGNDEMKPRQKLTAAPFAIRAQEALTAEKADDAQSLNGVPARNYVTQSQVSGFLTQSDIADFLTADDVTGLTGDSNAVCNLEGRLKIQFFDFPVSDQCGPIKRELTFAGDSLPILDFDLNRAGNPAMVVRAANTTQSLAYVVCTDITCSNFSYQAINNSESESRVALTFTLNGTPRIAFSTAGQTAVMLAECSDTQCSSSVLRTIDDESGRRFRHVDVATAPDGSLLFAYNSTNGAQFGGGFEASLRTTHCTNATCTLVTTRTQQTSGFSGGPVDTGGGTGSYPAIQFQQNGLPRIAYGWGFNQRLMMANCVDVRCSSSDLDDLEIAIVGDKDITFGSDGLRPVVFYRSASGLEIEEVCRFPDCNLLQNRGIEVEFDGAPPIDSDGFLSPQIEMLANDIPIFAYYAEGQGVVHGKCVTVRCINTIGTVVLDDTQANAGTVRFVIEPDTGDRLFTNGAFYIRCADRCGFD